MIVCGPEKGRLISEWTVIERDGLFGSSVLGYCLRPFADGVLGQLTGKQQAHCRLNLAAADGRFLVVLAETRCFSCNSFKDVVDEAVHDRHGATGHTGVGMNLLEYLVDVDSITFLPLPIPLLAAARAWGLNSFLRSLLCNLPGWSHGG